MAVLYPALFSVTAMVRLSLPVRKNRRHPPWRAPPTSPLPKTRVVCAYRPVRIVARDGQHKDVGTMACV